MKAENESFKAENESLKAENESLKAENESLKAEIAEIRETDTQINELCDLRSVTIFIPIQNPSPNSDSNPITNSISTSCVTLYNPITSIIL